MSTVGIAVFHIIIVVIIRCLFCFAGDIIFNAQYPELPPDFIFGEDAEFLPEPSELPVSIQTGVRLKVCEWMFYFITRSSHILSFCSLTWS